MSDELDLSQFKEIFISESKEKLALLNNQLVELEKNPKNINIINEIFRIAHTLKGMSATMGYDTLTSLTHTMEDVLDKLRKGEVEATGNTVNVIFECFDYLEKMINEIELSDKTSFKIRTDSFSITRRPLLLSLASITLPLLSFISKTAIGSLYIPSLAKVA